MINKFGVHGKIMWEYANGIDTSTVQYEVELPKSISHSTTLIKDTNNFNELSKVLFELTEKVTFRLRKYKLYATVITLQVRTKNFENYTKQKKINIPTSATLEIYNEVKNILYEVLKDQELRLIGVSVSGLVSTNSSSQLSLFDETNEVTKHKKYEKVDTTLDDIKNRFGNDSITFASRL